MKRSAAGVSRLLLPFVTLASVLLAAPAARASAFSLWPPEAVPANPSANDPGPVELGLRFRAATGGTVTAIRFYKAADNLGPHVGNLWTATGQLLGSVTFENETASGWQTAALAAPVAVDADVVYVVSYHAPVGRYSFDGAYFGVDHVNGPLTAPAAGGNGVFAYGAASAFPTGTFNATNYWVDVVFEDGPPDPNPPTVVSTVPAAGAVGVAVAQDVRATFSKALDPASVGAATFTLRDAGGALVPAAVTWEAAAFRAVLRPSSPLAYSTTYTATVSGGPDGVRDLDGQPLADDAVWSFESAAPPADEGPGGPILILTSAASPFSRYYVEILAAEGLNSYRAVDVTQLTSALLSSYDVVVLGEMALSPAQVSLLTAFVNGGGNLVAMRPDAQLAGLLGLSAPSGTLADAYLAVDATAAPGLGIVPQTIQFHGTADRYTTSGATPVATLYQDAATSTVHPAVTLRSVGANGGHAAAFAYDLARSVVYTRQGNPAFAGTERDGSSPIRPNDLFFPAYVDLDRVAIPQADEQQRLLANVLHEMQRARRPLPRFFYLPGGRKAVIVHALDDHNTSAGTRETFDKLNAASPAGCSVADWQCLRATSWGYTGIALTDAQAAAYQAQGHELGVHVNTNCLDWTPATLPAFFTNDLGAYQATFPSAAPQRSSRTHCIAWSDWATQAKVEQSRGIRFDMNYYYWPGSWVAGRPGFFTGSGLPMRFADTDGTRIDVYQAPSQLVNENDLVYPDAIAAMIDRAQGPEGYYGVLGTHDDYRDTAFSDGLVATALQKNVAIVSAAQMLDWLDGRNASSIGAGTYANGLRTFTVTADARARNLTLMVPASAAAGPLTALTRGGAAVPYTLETVKGVSYALVSATSGTYSAQYGTPAPAGPFTLWPASTLPTNASEPGDTASVELGVRFTSDVNGYVKGIRFYKGPGNTGVHRGNLWSASGALLANANFTGETATGWQQVLFATPVPVTAGTVYTASYLARRGRYAHDENYFDLAYDRPPLHALPNASGGNGVYRYGTSSAFPTSSYQSTNYWVDVVFDTVP
ncbi:MAG: DUF4082 domain-containing protein [Vicinamibacteria bacterium]